MPPILQQARHKDRIVGVTWLSLEAVELNPGSVYEARLRVQMTLSEEEDDMAEGEFYKSHWSEWSRPVSFPSPRRWRQGRCLWWLLCRTWVSLLPWFLLSLLHFISLQPSLCF